MKPFGVRLAAGAVTILLAAIMVAQAQKDQQADIDSAWNPETKTNPGELVPLGGAWATDDSSESQPPSDDAELSPFGDVDGAVQLVQHMEDSPAMGLPDSAADAVQNVASALMGLPEPMAEQHIEAPAMDLPDPLAGGPAMPAAPQPMSPPIDTAPAMGMTAAQALELLAQEEATASPANALRGAMEPQQAPMHTPDPEPTVMNSSPGQMIRSLALPGESQHQTPHSDHADLRSNENDLRLAQNAASPRLPMPNENQFGQDNRGMQEMPHGVPGVANHNQFRQTDHGPANHQDSGHQDYAQQHLPNRQPNQYGQDPNYDRLPANNNQQNTPRLQPQQQFVDAPPLPGNEPFRGTMARPASHALPKGNYAPGTGDQLRGGSFGQPGDRRLEGAQAPSVVIHKRAPSEVKVGKPASFVIHVQNVGSAEARNVQIHDQVPQGMRLVDATPRPEVVGNDGDLVWQLGALAAGEERQVTMQLVPEREGELGSVARVTFEAAASVRTKSTRPEIKIVQRSVKEVLIGQQLEIELEISNPGTGEATGVILQEDVPEGLEHPKGRQLDNLIGTLRPGEVRRQMLRLKAVAPGQVTNTIRLKADDGLEANHSVAVNVISPQLQVALTGPRVRYLERQATFTLDVRNTGTARAENVEIAAFLDRGFTFVSTQNQGTYDPSRHAVYWSVENIPVGDGGQIPLVLLPVQEGARAIQLEAKADLGIVAQNETQVAVNSLAELTFAISDTSDPIEIGGETTYEIRVKNSGSRPDSNVQVRLQFPPGLEVLSSDGDAQNLGNNTIAFRPKARLDANGEVTYQVKTRGVQAGTHLIKAIVNSQESRVPVTKEESTMVYDDRANIATQPGVGSVPFQR